MFFKKEILTLQKNIKRTTQDIHVTNKKKVLNLKRRKRLYFTTGTIFAAIFLLSGAWFFYAIKIKAEIAQFYPYSCLGGWQNPYNAQGKPDINENSDISEFNSNNSSILKNAISELFCGNFQGDEIPQDTEPKQATIKLSWAIADKGLHESNNIENINPGFPTLTLPEEIPIKALEEIPVEQEQVEPSTENAPSKNNSSENPSIDNDLMLDPKNTPETPDENTPGLEIPADNNSFVEPEIIPENTLEENNPAPESIEPSAFLPFLINPALAEEISDNLEYQQQITPENNDTQAAPIDVQAEAASTDIQIKITQENFTSPPTNQSNAITSDSSEISTPSTDFLEILYTIDGINWQTLKKVNLDNWQNLTLIIPEFQWADLLNFQIKLQSFSTNNIPLTIYLDALWIEIEYDKNISNNFEQIEFSDENFPTAIGNNNLSIDQNAIHKCQISPFAQTIKSDQTTNFTIKLSSPNPAPPSRIIFGNLPKGVKGRLRKMPDKLNEYSLIIVASKDSQIGSFGIAAIYQQKTKQDKISSTLCQFNLIILPGPEKNPQNIQNDLSPKPANTDTTALPAISEIIP